MWTLPRVERCCEQVWAVASRVATVGVPAILDQGPSTVADRKRFIAAAVELGYPIRLHFLDVPIEYPVGRSAASAPSRWAAISPRWCSASS